MTGTKNWIRVLAAVALLPLGACDLLNVNAPGRIADEDLNNPEAFSGIVAGMAYNLATGMDDINQDEAIFTQELWHGGSYDFAEIPLGVVTPEDNNAEWSGMQQARWVAEDGLRRIETNSEPDAFNSSAVVAEGYVYAGFSNRVLGEMLCTTAIDGGPEEDNAVHFDRAEEAFSKAIDIGGRAGATDIVNAAYGGRASVKAWMGDWAGAVADAQQVPASFVFVAEYTNEVANDLRYETYDRFEFSVHGTEFANYPDDPRAPWEIIYNADGTVANGANGSTPHYQQKKYPDLSSPVPLTKGTEMLVLRAEAALRNNDIDGALGLLDQAREQWGMPPITQIPTTIREAWVLLHHERGAETWLETRRIWDLRRWYEAGSSAPEYNSFYEGRDTCFPISEEERRSNENLSPI